MPKHKPAANLAEYGNPSTELLPERLSEHHFPNQISATEKKAKLYRTCVVHSKPSKWKQFIDAVNVKQPYVWRDSRVPRIIIQIATSDMVASFKHINDVQLIR
jgi:hypothetical protein